MQQSKVNGLLKAVLVGLALFAASLQAQLSTSKVEGTVRDKETGTPLQGVQVVIEGTRLGNITNADGYYFILNVPPGRRDISFNYTGYQKVTIREQLILAGQTITVNANLSSTVVQLEGITIEGESEILAPRDNTVTKHRLTTESLVETPATVLEDLLVQQAGVVTGGQGALARGVRIRGGRIGQEMMVVDGMPVRNQTALADRTDDNSVETGAQGQDVSPLELSTEAIEEVDILTGGFQAEYGNAQSGIINIVTKEGGPQLSGRVRFTTDEMNPRTADYGYNQLVTTIGGPIPGVPNLYFQGTGEIQGEADRTPTHADEGFRGINEDFVDYLNAAVANDPVLGLRKPAYTLDMFKTGHEFYASRTGGGLSLFSPSNPVRLPGNWGDRTLANGKITYSPIPSLKIIALNQWSRNQNSYPSGPAGDGDYFQTGIVTRKSGDPMWEAAWGRSPFFAKEPSRTELYIPQSQGRRVRANNMLFGGDWNFLQNSRQNALLQFRYSRFRTNEINSSMQAADWKRESTFMSWDAHDLRFEVERYPNREIQQGLETLDWYPDGAFENHDGERYETPFLVDTYSIYTLQYRYSREWQNNYKMDVDFQWNRTNRAKLGVQISDYDNDMFRVRQHVTKRNEMGEFRYQPKLFAAYLQNRTDLGDFVFDYGVRWDQFQPVDNWGINQSDPFGQSVSPTVFTEVSPRFNVGFPVTDRSQLRFSYGAFTQIPSFNVLFNYQEYGGNANPGGLGYSRTDAFEAGLSYLVNNDMVLDLVTYYRDINGDVSSNTFFIDQWLWHSEQRVRNWMSGYSNRDNGNVKGFDLTLKKRFSNNFSYNLIYTMQFVRTTGDNELGSRGYDAASNSMNLPPDELRPGSGDQTHKLTAQLNYQFPLDVQAGKWLSPVLREFGLYAVYQLNSGTPGGDAPGVPMAYRGRWYSNLDLRFSKNLGLGRTRRVQVFAEVFNALNRRDKAAYPKDYRLESYLHITGGADLQWNQLAEGDWERRARFQADFNGDGVLTDEEAGMGALANAVMMSTMDKRNWGTARQIRAGVDFSF
ncbi:TonB-dependent receptor [bacterium]|nr:TonB-dependent receptor [bacterium]